MLQRIHGDGHLSITWSELGCPTISNGVTLREYILARREVSSYLVRNRLHLQCVPEINPEDTAHNNNNNESNERKPEALPAPAPGSEPVKNVDEEDGRYITRYQRAVKPVMKYQAL